MREECQIELSVYADVEVLLCMHIYPRKVSKHTLYFYPIIENTQNKVR